MFNISENPPGVLWVLILQNFTDTKKTAEKICGPIKKITQ
jgi:hypothetical protein